MVGVATIIAASIIAPIITSALSSPSAAKSPAAAPSSQSATKPSASDCKALTDAARKEATTLIDLQNSIQLDAPTSRVTGHTAGYASAYNQAFALIDTITSYEQRYKYDGQRITGDPYLDSDLRQLPTDVSIHLACAA